MDNRATFSQIAPISLSQKSVNSTLFKRDLDQDFEAFPKRRQVKRQIYEFWLR